MLSSLFLGEYKISKLIKRCKVNPKTILDIFSSKTYCTSYPGENEIWKFIDSFEIKNKTILEIFSSKNIVPLYSKENERY